MSLRFQINDYNLSYPCLHLDNSIHSFLKCFHWLCWIQWQKMLSFKKIIRSSHLPCKRSRCYHSANKTHVAERIFKLSPIHAWVIYQIPRIRWIHWISDPFRENSNTLFRLVDRGLVDHLFELNTNHLLWMEHLVKCKLIPTVFHLIIQQDNIRK